MPDVFDLHTHVALVTGGAGDIGSAICHTLANSGARVAVADIDDDAAAATADSVNQLVGGHESGGSAAAFHLDVTDSSSVSECVEAIESRWGPCTILVNNAILAPPIPRLPHQMPDELWNGDISVIVNGGFHCARRVLGPMVANRRGIIVTMLSVNAHAFYGHPSYSAAKAAMRSFTQSLACIYGSRGIRVVSISPGTIGTRAWQAQLAEDPAVLDRMQTWYPLGRIGTPQDVAGAVAFLCSESASWISGADLVVDGGLMAGNGALARAALGS